MTKKSAKPHASKLGDNVLIGTAERLFKMGFVEINIYSLGLYIDPKQCQEPLSDFQGFDYDGLLRHPDFYSKFASGHFTKMFCLTFCRSIEKKKLLPGFEDPLRSRCDEAHMADAELLLSNLVPESGVSDNDVLTLVCAGDGKTLTAAFKTAKTGIEKEMVRIESGGDGGAWSALQNIFFDDDTHLPTIRLTACVDLPDVLDCEEEYEGTVVNQVAEREPTVEEIEQAVEVELEIEGDMSGSIRKMDWQNFAGRKKGESKYKFGDISRGVTNTVVGIAPLETKNKPIVSKKAETSDKIETKVVLKHKIAEPIMQSSIAVEKANDIPFDEILKVFFLIELLGLGVGKILGLSLANLSLGKLILTGLVSVYRKELAITFKVKLS